jgi:hypothetical protein
VASYGPKYGANTIPLNEMSQIFKRFYAEAGIDTMGEIFRIILGMLNVASAFVTRDSLTKP